MALPLPNVIPDVGPGGRIFDVMNKLGQSANAMTFGQAQAKYAPYTAYSNALSKMAYANMLPYQIQSTIMSNPLVWQAFKDRPEALSAMMNNLMGSIPRGNQVTGNINMPRPDEGIGGGLMGLLLDRLNNKPTNQETEIPYQNKQTENNFVQPSSVGYVNQPQASGSSLLPSTQGGMAGVLAQKTAPFSTSPYKSGSLVDIGGEPTSIPTESTKSAAQSSINAAERVAPQLERIADLAGPFLSLKGMAQNQIERLSNLVDPTGQRQLPAKYAEYRAILKAAPEALVKSYGLRPTNETIHRMEQIIEPYFGETKEQYKTRIARQLESIKEEQIGISKKQLSEGFKLGKESPGEKNLAKGLEIPNFESKEKFLEWYNRQPDYTKKAIKIRLGGR